MFRSIILCTFLGIVQLLCGMNNQSEQLTKADSLKSKLANAGAIERIDILNELASHYATINFDSSIMFSAQAMQSATVYGYDAGVGIARLNTGNAYYYRMDLKNALLSYLSALKTLEELNPSKKLGELYMQLGNINYYIGRTEKSITFYKLALKSFKAIHDDSQALQVPYAIMFTYLIDNQSDSAEFYGKVFLTECDKLNDQNMRAHGLNVLGWAYSQMLTPESRQKAIDCNYESLEIGKEMSDETLIAVNYLNLGNNYDRCDWAFEGSTVDLVLARSFHEKAFLAAHKAGLHLLMGAISNYLAAIDIEEGKFKQAEVNLQNSKNHLDTVLMAPYAHSSTGPFNSFGKMVDYILAQQHRVYMYERQFKLEMARGKTNKAIEYLHLIYQYSDSIYAQQQARQFELIMAEAEADKTDQKIRALMQENELRKMRLNQSLLIFSTVAGAILLISMALLLFIQHRRNRAEQKSASMEQRLLRAQMNPHFLFNSLASIQNYIINEKSDEASLYLSRFSQLVRNVLDNSAEEFVSLENEVDAIQNYLELQKVRYAGKFDFKLLVDNQIDPEFTYIPPMLAQPFIENSIEHGIKHLETKGYIDIRFLLDDGLIRFEVEDNGVGREKAGIIEHRQNSHHRSLSTSITRERLLAIGQKIKKKIKLEIIDLKNKDGNACGTKVTFRIPCVSNHLKDEKPESG
ncbi:MAG: histidine kinase [Bacteroidetes bacterium]|nr:histidine kinase [Bacteroidota bacterium]